MTRASGVRDEDYGAQTPAPVVLDALIDTHCHLDLPAFDGDRDAVLHRAAEAGVAAIVAPAIDLDSCRRVLALADRHPNVYAAVGVHPNDCATFDDDTAAALRGLARHPKVVAIGEIGLDYHWKRVAPDRQRRALRAQLALAAELSLPVILHSRAPASPEQVQREGGTSCHADLLWEMERWWSEIRTRRPSDAIVGVWHAFSGDLAQAQQAYGLGLVLGLGGPVTFQNARRLHALVLGLDPDRILLETDAPYLAPHPYRGQRNEPAFVVWVAQELARLSGVTPEVVAQRTAATARRCFGFDLRTQLVIQ